GKAGDRHDGTRPRRLADAVVHAQTREQAAEEDERDRDGRRELVPRQPEDRLELVTEKLSDAADQPADDERAQTVVKMFGRRRERADIREIIFVDVRLRGGRTGSRTSTLRASAARAAALRARAFAALRARAFAALRARAFAAL